MQNFHCTASIITILFIFKLSLGLLKIHLKTTLVTFTSGGRGSETFTIFTISKCHNWGMEGGSASQFGHCHQISRFFILKASLMRYNVMLMKNKYNPHWSYIESFLKSTFIHLKVQVLYIKILAISRGLRICNKKFGSRSGKVERNLLLVLQREV